MDCLEFFDRLEKLMVIRALKLVRFCTFHNAQLVLRQTLAPVKLDKSSCSGFRAEASGNFRISRRSFHLCSSRFCLCSNLKIV